MKRVNALFILVTLILTFSLSSAGDYRFQNLTGSDLMIIKGSNGFIGIGTTSPLYKLSVIGNVDARSFTEGGISTLSNDISGALVSDLTLMW